ncbi:hypothetical protein FDC49_04980 [Clostridium sporogenes]|uniref:DUF3784 domain-containing protein n=2 Tax=Clostridium TaxID=1485 RepID=A0ABC8CSF4_CLOBO|nr:MULTISPECIES: hypothetical protein [Clostridium]AVQ38042.1 hypothetical protein C7M56_04840 [Clostridium botulinum]NFG95385.1 hypothetical protein [Clostridium sporogenes]NFH31722.1 hypothetical protein [Clostridium sporogenes]NFL19128.1 hypothetical protein [Clostridium sporogenes]NFL74669.1 hypothetical protein [Clostridium sporogenes]
MLKILGSIMILLGGVALVIFSIYNNHKEIMKIANKDNNRLKKYFKHKKLLNLIVGFCFVILGIVPILNIYNGDLIGIISLIILFFDKIIEFRIDKKHKETS